MDDKGKSGGSAVLVFSLATAALFSLYVLSIGPVAYLSSTGQIEYTKTNAESGFYAPMFWVSDHCEPAETALYWYIGFWTK